MKKYFLLIYSIFFLIMSCNSNDTKGKNHSKRDSFIISSSTGKNDLTDNEVKDDTLKKELKEYLEKNSWNNRKKISNDSTEKLLRDGVLKSEKW